MAQRKPSSGGKPGAKKGTSRPAGKPGAAPSAAAAARAKAAPKKAPARKPGKSIVNQKQTPWGTIVTVAAVIAFAAAVIVVVIVTRKDSDSTDRYKLPEIAQAKAIDGVKYKVEPQHSHVNGTVNYNTDPPTGGDHNSWWADCNGTVYSQPIANENAVHPLEHGAVWVTYREGLPQSDVDKLAAQVQGQDHVFMSPYPDLRTEVSLQAWNYQLFVNSVDDKRIPQFIAALAANPDTTPEVGANGAAVSCANPSFISSPSTFGHPLSAPTVAPSTPAGSTPESSGAGSSPAGSTANGSQAP